jgi:hypothetical protein
LNVERRTALNLEQIRERTMPKKLNYPLFSLEKSLLSAKKAYQQGNSLSKAKFAAILNQKISGPFHNLLSALSKFDLLKTKKNQIIITDLLKNIMLSYSKEEKKKYLQESFLKIPLYKKLWQNYETKKIPIEILEKILVKEYEIPVTITTKVKNNFLADLKFLNLSAPSEAQKTSSPTSEKNSKNPELLNTTYLVHITGQNLNFEMEINNQQDLKIVEMILEKLKKNL